jgi:prenyltransferase beta subunit
MGLWSEMMRRASLGAAALGIAARRAEVFLRGQWSDDGGFRNRAGRSDLYYTAFGLSATRAIGAQPPDGAAEYLAAFGSGGELDLIHLSCLARSWACLDDSPRARAGGASITAQTPRWRAADGGYSQEAGAPRGNVYGCFLAAGVYHDCDMEAPDADGIVRCVLACRAAGGGFSNSPGEAMGLSPITAGAAALLRSLERPVEREWGEWLAAKCFQCGGFVAHPFSPEPDLLSTAVSLHAAHLLGVPLAPERREACADFVMGLQTSGGGFRGAASDALPDCEYTFYGLLAMGNLADGTS